MGVISNSIVVVIVVVAAVVDIIVVRVGYALFFRRHRFQHGILDIVHLLLHKHATYILEIVLKLGTVAKYLN